MEMTSHPPGHGHTPCETGARGSQRAPWIDVPSAPPGSRSGPPRRVRGRECSFPGLSPVPGSRVLTPGLLWIMAQPPDVLAEKKLWPHGAQIFLPGGHGSTGLFHLQSALALRNLHPAAHKLQAGLSPRRCEAPRPFLGGFVTRKGCRGSLTALQALDLAVTLSLCSLTS